MKTHKATADQLTEANGTAASLKADVSKLRNTIIMKEREIQELNASQESHTKVQFELRFVINLGT